MGKRYRKSKRAAAVAPAPAADGSMASAEAPGVEHHHALPLAPAEEVTDARDAAVNGEATATEPDSTPPERGDAEAEAATLKRLNGILVSAADKERKRVAALEARLADLADAGALADAEREVLLAAVLGPLRAAEEERAALLERLAAALESVERAEAEAAREAGARAEDAAKLQAAVVENEHLVEMLRVKEDEAAAAAEKVAGLEAAVAGLEAMSSDLRAERSELEIQLEAARASAREIQSEKEVLESSFNEFMNEAEMYKQEMEAKIQDQLKELKVLQSGKVELEAKVSSLEAELSVAVGRNHELELEMDKLKAEVVAAKEEVEKFPALFAVMEHKHSVAVAEMARLESEIEQLVKAKQAAAEAHDAEKKIIQAELEMLKGNVDRIQVEKDDAIGMVQAKDAEAEKLRDELKNFEGIFVEMEQKQSAAVAEVDRLKSELDQLVKGNEVAAVALDEKKTMEAELETLKGSMDRVQAEKDDALGLLHAKDAEAGKLRDELKKLHNDMAELRAICDELDGKSSFLHDEKILVLKEVEEKKAEAEQLKLKIQELESYNRDKDHEIGELKAEVGVREKQISDLTEELEHQQLAVTEAERRGSNVVWTWLGPATTTVVAAASFVYAARSR